MTKILMTVKNLEFILNPVKTNTGSFVKLFMNTTEGEKYLRRFPTMKEGQDYVHNHFPGYMETYNSFTESLRAVIGFMSIDWAVNDTTSIRRFVNVPSNGFIYRVELNLTVTADRYGITDSNVNFVKVLNDSTMDDFIDNFADEFMSEVNSAFELVL